MFCIGALNKGGAERVVSVLSNEFIKQHEVEIVLNKEGKIEYPLDSKVVLKYLDDTDKKSAFRRLSKLNQIIKKDNPDIILSFLPEPSFRVMLVNFLRRKKVIISVRNDPNVEYASKIYKILYKLLYPHANGFVFQTEDAQKFFSEKIQKKSTIIPNPVSKQFLCERFEGEREKTIVTVGVIKKQKNQKLLIDAFDQIAEKYPDYTLKIYGDGDIRDEVVKYASEKKSKDNILFMGKVDDVKSAIYQDGIFVLSSDFEGMPNALMEAMALGLPCISTDCPIGGPKSLIHEGENGLLIPVGDQDALVTEILKLIEDKSLANKISMNANHTMKQYSKEIISDRWIKYIESLVS